MIEFQYIDKYNFLKFEMYNVNDDKISESLVALFELEYDRFTFRRLVMKDNRITNNPEMWNKSLNQLNISFFINLQDTFAQHSNLFKILSTFQRRLQDVTNITTLQNYTELSSKFEGIVKFNLDKLKSIFSEQHSYEIINETYSYVNINNFAHIT